LRAAQWSTVGGVLGVLGWATGPTLGAAFADIVEKSHFLSYPGYAEDTPYYFSLYLVWQTGMGAVIGILFARSNEAEVLGGQTSQPVRGNSGVARICFMAIVILALAYCAITGMPGQYQAMRIAQAQSRHDANIPSLENPEKVEPQPVDQVMIVAAIGDYLPRRASVDQCRPVLDWKTRTPKDPAAECYLLWYSPSGNSDLGPNVTPRVEVQVRDYPSSAWARYEIFGQASLSPVDPEERIESGNKVYAETQFANKSGSSHYVWSSGRHLIILHFFLADPNEFLKAYLAKYPSSL